MKKLNGLWLMALLMILPLGFASCSDDDEEGFPNDLIGNWTLVQYSSWEKENGKIVQEETEKKNNESVIFNVDGTGSYFYFRNLSTEEFTTKWEYKKGRLFLTMLESGVNVKVCKELKIKTITKNKLVTEKYEKYHENGIKYEEYELKEYRRVEQ